MKTSSAIPARVLVIAMILGPVGSAQILQDHGALCGNPRQTYIPLPPGISAISSDAHSVLTLRLLKSTVNLDFSGDGTVVQVCPLPQRRLLVFASPGQPVYDVYLIDAERGTELGSVALADPAVSPDQRWLAGRMPTPPSAEVSVSEEYLLFDLSALSLAESTGRVLYPAVEGRRRFANYGVPAESLHSFDSDALFWASDSRFVALADRTPKGLNFVMVRVSEKDLAVYVHPVLASEACAGAKREKIMGPGLTLSEVVFTHGGGATIPQVTARFRPIDTSCAPQEAVFPAATFREAALELHDAPLKKPSHKKGGLPPAAQ